MEEKNFAAQVLDAVKSHAFEFKKILFNLDDCVPRTELEDAKKNLRQAQEELSRREKKISRLENEIDNKTSEITDLLRQNGDLKRRVDNQRDELERRQISLQQAQENISRLEKNLAEKSSRLEETTAKLARYSDLGNAFDAYKNLSDQTKFALEGVFGAGDDPTSFLAGALQDGHLESLFDYIATTLNSHANPSEVETLLALFDFSFAAVNSGRREKIFARLNVNDGDEFNAATMRKTSDSPQSGSVKKILLIGYKYIRTNKTVRPSLVVLG